MGFNSGFKGLNCHSATASAFHGIWLKFDHQTYKNRPRIVTNKISAYKYVARVSQEGKGRAQRHKVVYKTFPTAFFEVICCLRIQFSYLEATYGRRESVVGIVSRLQPGKPRNHGSDPGWNSRKRQGAVLYLTTLSTVKITWL